MAMASSFTLPLKVPNCGAWHTGGRASKRHWHLGLKGVPEDKREAVKWNRMAAVQGDIVAQYNLAHAYATGSGVAKDDLKTYVWANIAVSGLRGSDSEEMINQLQFFKKIAASALSPKQLELAQKISNECLMNSFKGCN
jgi:hypothetical protein